MYPNRCGKCRFWQNDLHAVNGICKLHSHPWISYKDTERLRKTGDFDPQGYLRTKYYFTCRDFESMEQ